MHSPSTRPRRRKLVLVPLSSRTRRAGIIAWFGALAPDERIDQEPAEQAARRVRSRAPEQPLLHRLILGEDGDGERSQRDRRQGLARKQACCGANRTWKIYVAEPSAY